MQKTVVLGMQMVIKGMQMVIKGMQVFVASFLTSNWAPTY